MKSTAIFLCVTLSVLAPGEAALAKGCVKGALVGGIAGHYAGHHGVLGYWRLSRWTPSRA